jgi:hypothetical protein
MLIINMNNINSISNTSSTNNTNNTNNISWTIGHQYELMEKGGTLYELGTLQDILENGSLRFKKPTGEIHTYRVETGVSYRLVICILPQTPHTLNMGLP